MKAHVSQAFPEWRPSSLLHRELSLALKPGGNIESFPISVYSSTQSVNTTQGFGVRNGADMNNLLIDLGNSVSKTMENGTKFEVKECIRLTSIGCTSEAQVRREIKNFMSCLVILGTRSCFLEDKWFAQLHWYHQLWRCWSKCNWLWSLDQPACRWRGI